MATSHKRKRLLDVKDSLVFGRWKIHCVFGGPKARVVTLVNSSKKERRRFLLNHWE
jgi:hypothetical protein